MNKQYFIGTAFGGLFITDNKVRQYSLNGVFLNETTPVISGSATITEAAETVTGTATHPVTGSANITEAADTLSASGSLSAAAAPGGGGGGRGSRSRPVIVWLEEKVEEVVAEAVANIQTAPKPKAKRPQYKALFGPTAVIPTAKQVIREVRRIEPDGPSNAQIMAAMVRLRIALAEQDDEEAAWLLMA